MYVHLTLLILSLPLAIVNNASMKIGMLIFLDFHHFWIYAQDGIAGSYGLLNVI